MMIRHHDIDVGDVKPGSDQSLPPELAKHDPLDRPQVIIGASITVCDLVYVFSTKMSSLGSRGGGRQNRRFDGAPEECPTGFQKSQITIPTCSGCLPRGVCIRFATIGIRMKVLMRYEKL